MPPEFEGNTERKYNVGIVFKRAMGEGRITGIDGLGSVLERFRPPRRRRNPLLRPGTPRRDWRATLISDGMIIVRHPELQPVIEMTERFATDLQMYAD